MAKRVQSVTARLEGARKVRQRALDERVRLIALVSAHYPGSHLAPSRRQDVSWDYFVCVHLPSGPIGWRLPNEDIAQHFQHLPLLPDDLDAGATLETKLTRMDAVITALPKP